MKEQIEPTPIDTEIPAFLKREKNAKGVTLSGGTADKVVDQTTSGKQVTVTAAKTPSKKELAATAKAEKKAAKLAADAAKREARAAAKAAIAALPAPVVGPDGEPLEKVKRSIVPMKFKERYKGHGGTCGDDMALELKAATTTRNADKRECLDVDALWAIARANQIDVGKYVDLNNGQKRMNVGNKLRGKLAAGADVVIGARQFKAEDFVPKH